MAQLGTVHYKGGGVRGWGGRGGVDWSPCQFLATSDVLIRSVVFCCVTGALCLPGLPGCPCAKPVSPQASPQLSRSSSRFSNSSRRSAGKGPYLSVQRGVDSTASPNECSCCCCNEDLIKIQVNGLLFGASLAYFSIECR